MNFQRWKINMVIWCGSLDPDGSDWTHGFNSGMLACLRFVATALEQDIEAAHDEFPVLDT